jgi:hypothetical protein
VIIVTLGCAVGRLNYSGNGLSNLGRPLGVDHHLAVFHLHVEWPTSVNRPFVDRYLTARAPQ